MSKVIALALGFSLALCGCGNGNGGDAFGTCVDLKSKWEACGGDPKGAWGLSKVCHADYPNPWEQECPNATATGKIQATATAEIGADTIQFGTATFKVEAGFEIPTDCIATIGATDCKGMQDLLISDPNAQATCTDQGQTCKCHFTNTDPEKGNQEPYSLSGTNLIIGATGDEDSIPFCVKGSQMAWKMDPSDESIEFFLFKKK